jgi:hypothetical protein
LCDLAVRPYPITNTTAANFPTRVYSLKQNVALLYAEGVDMNLNYVADLSQISDLDGIVGLRLSWSHQPTLKNQTLPGTTIINTAGTSQTPKDRISLQVNYMQGPFNFGVMQRYYGPFHFTGNPTLVGAYTLPAYWQTDINLAYDFEAAGQPVTGFLNINNLFNQFGANCCAFPSDPGKQYPVAAFTDRLGHYFVAGIRFNTN